MPHNHRPNAVELIVSAATALKDKRDEVNKLNVFPVPDGDTGTNMSLTMDAVVAEVRKLPEGATLAEIAHAITHGSLMGARGNSGVILSQILRGLCEGFTGVDHVDVQTVAAALDRSVTVAFQAVRKPVEGTMLTVLRDAATAAPRAAEAGEDITGVLEAVVIEAFESVRRTPDLLPVLKESGVVDAGGYGLAILFEGFSAGLSGHEIRSFDVTVRENVEPILSTGTTDDWDDDEYLYCTEFLMFGTGMDRVAIEDFMVSIGGSQLVVGTPDQLKVHVHTDDPSEALAYALQVGEVAEVHVHNMRRQSAERAQSLRDEAQDLKPLGFVAVAAGEGLTEILKSLGVDAVVGGGQTMNPSTAELLEAIDAVPAHTVIVLPNNKNIIMAANQTVGLASKEVGVVPTTAVPQA
ncbi:MAG: DAK2 domain-containing protein, partial [Coriobacteriia bacterium]|nr:DAK2 domain-containing protein [Coriobacteriia bacterium]